MITHLRNLMLGLAILGTSLSGHATSDEMIKSELKGGSFRASLPEGFHFNEKAPNLVTIDGVMIKPSVMSARSCEFSGLPTKWSAGKAALYVCDDALTFCQPHTVELKGAAAKGRGTTKAVKAVDTHKGTINHQGFIEDDLSKALTEAAKKNQLVLIDFSARWCPGCVRYENETFDTAEFKQLSKDFIKLKLDVDRFENTVLADKYNVKGIPSLIVVNSQQEEINRIIDFQPNDILKTFFISVQEDSRPLNQLVAEAAKNKSVKVILGRRLAAAGRYRESLTYLADVKPAPAEWLEAKVGAAAADYKANPETKPAYVLELRVALKAEPDTVRSLSWRADLAELIEDPSELKALRQDGENLAEIFLQDSAKLKRALRNELAGEFAGYENFLVALNRASLVDSTKADEKDVLQTWQKAAGVVAALNIPVSKMGLSLRYLIVLIQAKMYEQADILVNAMLAIDPDNPEFQRRQLRIFLETKQYHRVIEIGKKCIAKSYGRNEFWVAESMAKAYMGERLEGQSLQANKNEQELLALLDKYLGRPEIEWPTLKNSRKTMEDIRAKLKE